MNLYFEIYKGNDFKFYWRLRKKNSYSNSLIPTADPIIATGHQGYSTIESVKVDIEYVKKAIPNTQIYIRN